MLRTMKFICVSSLVLLLSAAPSRRVALPQVTCTSPLKMRGETTLLMRTLPCATPRKAWSAPRRATAREVTARACFLRATYAVTVDAKGFQGILSTGVSVTVGGLVELPITLAVATGKEVVEVSSQAELVETSRTSTTDTIGERRIDNLPSNGRNYINFTLTDSQVGA